jgi:hypothetical protein
MTRLEIIKIVRKLLVKGQIQKALVALYTYTEGVDKELESDIVLLQSSLTTNQEQYEIKQIITKQEHDLTQSRTILAIENLLDKLPQQSVNTLSDDLISEDKTSLPMSKTWANPLVLGVIGLLVATAIGFAVMRSCGSQRVPQVVASPVVVQSESNFMGEWSAKVTKTGYHVERGLKKYFENATATWRVNVLPNHTLTMAGTIDTTGMTKLRWDFDPTTKIMTFIQEDNYSFDAKVEVNEPKRQVWRTITQEANKVDEWEWELTK